MTIPDQEKQLKALLPSIWAIRLSGTDSPIKLLALARIYIALNRLVSVEGRDAEFGDRTEYTRLGDRLFRILLRKARRATNPVERATLISASFRLTCETTLASDAKRDNSSRQAVVDLLADHGDLLGEPSILRCLTDCFYPKTESDDADPWFITLKRSIRHWAEALSPDGDWPDVTYETALARIEVMNRNSYMLLDETYDPMISKAYGFYKSHVPAYKASLLLLSSLYDVAMQGNAYPVDREIGLRAANVLATYAGNYSTDSAERLFCLSHEVDALCENMLYESQKEEWVF